MTVTEYTCVGCRHGFPWFGADDPEPSCPRCGGAELDMNPWLLLTPDTLGITAQEHYEASLSV